MPTAATLKTLANKHTAFDGAVVFYIMGYRTLQTDHYIQRLEAIEPQWEYVHEKTGERTSVQPEAYRAALENAEATGLDMMPSAWTRTRLWTETHDMFWLIVPLTVDIEFHPTKKTPTPVKALQAYWQNANGSVEHNWLLFTHALPPLAITEWGRAYNATRDESMAAAEVLQEGEPDKELDPNVTASGSTNSEG